MRAIFCRHPNKKTIFSREKTALKRFLFWQLIAAVIISAMVRVLWSSSAATSALFGSTLALLPNVFLVILLFASTKHASSRKIVRACYMGEVLKIILIALLFMVMLRVYDVMLEPLLIGFGGTYGVYWMSAFLW